MRTKELTALIELLVFYIAMILLFKIIFYKEGLFNILKLSSMLFFGFILPGFMVMSIWDFGFIEKIFVGLAISISFISIMSFYLNLFGLNSKYHLVILSPLMILVGLLSKYHP